MPTGTPQALPDADEHDGRTLPLESDHPASRPEEATDLLADRREDLGGPHSLRHQRRHSPQRRLLVGEPSQCLPRLGIGNRGGDDLTEVVETILGVERQRLVLASRR